MTRINYDEAYEMPKLDVKDKKILDILSENSRMPISQIAKKVEVSRDVANYKINRLQKLGIVEGFVPRIDFRKLGFNTYHVFMMIDESKEEKKLIEKLKGMKETLFVFEYSDKWDLELVMIAKNVRQLDKIVSKLQAEFSETIIEKMELLEINTYQSILFSYYFNQDLHKLNLINDGVSEDGNIGSLKKKKDSFKLDEIDFEILKQLCVNARSSTYEIAKEVSLSADAIGLRIKRLVKEGIIKKFTILTNFSVLNYTWHTFCIKMRVFDERNEKKFRAFIERHPGIIRAAKTFGEWDVIMYILNGQPKEFHKLIKEIKTTFPEIIKSYITFVGYKEHYYNSIPEVVFEKEN